MQVPPMRGGYEFTIRTPGQPRRWAHYHDEFVHLFRQLEDIIDDREKRKDFEKDKGDKESWLEEVSDIALSFFYYWVNFGPLTRGSAATGYAAMYAIFLAAGVVITEGVAEGFQYDWEAIFSASKEEFFSIVRHHIYPARRVVPIGGDKDPLQGVPSVGSTFFCIRTMIEALNAE